MNAIQCVGRCAVSVVTLAWAGVLSAAPALALPTPAFTVVLGGPSHQWNDRLVRLDLDYHPLSNSARAADRLASWNALRISALDKWDWARRSDGWLKVTAQGHYYHNAGASEAFDLYRQGQRSRTQGLVWAVASPAAGAGVGAGIGAIVGLLQPHSAYNYDREQYSATDVQTQHGDIGAVIGALVGGSIGFGVGWWVATDKAGETHALRARAAESFNRSLWRDLRLDPAPLPGGGALKLRTAF